MSDGALVFKMVKSKSFLVLLFKILKKQKLDSVYSHIEIQCAMF
jgi:hypothetical protein